MKSIMNCMKSFLKCSSLKVNLAKSIVYCSPNTCSRTKKRIGEVDAITVTNNMGKYQGIPILQKRVSRNTFGYILETMKMKLESWKADNLSFSG